LTHDLSSLTAQTLACFQENGTVEEDREAFKRS